MNRTQAIHALLNGEVLTHRNFTREEWVRQVEGQRYVFEDGHTCTPEDFWRHDRGTEESFNQDWEVKKDPINTKTGEPLRMGTINGHNKCLDVYETALELNKSDSPVIEFDSLSRQEVVRKSGFITGPDYTGGLKPYRRTDGRVGRNKPCPCSSGLKYKKCHGL